MSNVEPEAITIEDEYPLDLAGEEAGPPVDAGRRPSDEDLELPSGELPELPEVPEGARSTWRPARSLLALRNEINHRWPNRDKRTDGFIGDANHCGPGRPPSEHCVNAAGVVRAFDIDSDGIASAWLADHLRNLGRTGDRRMTNGGYVIFNRRIASQRDNWVWRVYTGHAHQDHIHLTVSSAPDGYDSNDVEWGVVKAPAAPEPRPGDDKEELPKHPLGSRTLRYQEESIMVGTDVGFVQRWVGIEDDGWFGTKTKARVERYQGKVGLPQTGVVGPETWRTMRVEV